VRGHIAVPGMPVAAGVRGARLVLVVLVVPVPITVVEGGEEASSASAPVSEAVVTEGPASEAATPEPQARNAHTDAATAAQSTVASPHGRPCRSASQRKHEEPGKEEGRQATNSISKCGRHGSQ
jgi:hypothetical protein